MSIIFDSHCHPQFPQYDADREEMLARAKNAGVAMVCVGTDLEASKQGIELARTHENIWATIGLHPNAVSEHFDTPVYQSMLQEPKVVAVGEIGLDYYRTPEPEKQERQKEVFKQFLDLAIQYDKPVVLHARDAAKGSTGRVFKDLFEILNSYFLIHNSKLRGVVHSCTASLEEVKELLNLGFYFGFNGIITFARQYDEVVRFAPLDRILIETDAPYLTPLSRRSSSEGGRTRNEPAYVIEVAKKLAELKNEPLEKVIESTTENCKKLFKI
jgi:TatD DNase family protein